MGGGCAISGEVEMGTGIGDFEAFSIRERPCRTAVVLGM